MAEKARKIKIKDFFQALLNYFGHDILAVLASFLVFFATTKLIFAKSSSTHLFDTFWIVWCFASLVAALIYFFVGINRYIRKGIAPRLLPVIPSLILGVVFITIEFFLSPYILSLSTRFFASSKLSALLVLMISILLIELVRRHSSIMSGFKNVSFKISSFIELTVENVEKTRLFIIYWLLNVIFIVLSSIFIYKGYISPLDNYPTSANELFSNVLTIVTGILAIFFAGATLVMQLIVGAYSYKFVEALFRSPIFVSAFLIYLLVGIAHLVFLRIGWNSYFATFSIVSAIYILLSLVILLRHFKDWVQVPYVIGIITNDIRKYISKFKKPKSRPSGYNIRPMTPSLKYQFRSYFLTAFLGENYKDPYLEEAVSRLFPKHIQEKIIEDTRPLLTACLKAVNEDRREVVLACLSGVNEITKTYIDKFDYLIFTIDDFFMFLYDQLSIIYEAAIESRNQQFTFDIVQTAVKIGKSCLILTDARENKHVFIWIQFLQESVIKSLHLQRTSAQMTACTEMAEIGKLLIGQKAFSTALYVVAESLYKIGQSIASIRHMWTTAITTRVNSALLELLLEYAVEARRSGVDYQHFVQDICQKLANTLDVAYKTQSNDGWTMMNITNSVVAQNRGLNLSGVASVMLTVWDEKSSKVDYALLSQVRELLFLISRSAHSAIINKKYTIEDYCSALSEIGYMLVEFVVKVKEKSSLKEAERHLRLAVGIAEGLVEQIIKYQPDHSYENFHALSLFYASLIYFSVKGQDGLLLNLYVASIKKLKDLINSTPKKELDNRGYRNLYYYIKLFSAWMYYFDNKNTLNKELKQFLRQKVFPSFLFEENDYPGYFVKDDWRNFPLNRWPSRGLDMLGSLRDVNIYNQYFTKRACNFAFYSIA